jgi:hypothetical protein
MKRALLAVAVMIVAAIAWAMAPDAKTKRVLGIPRTR